MPKSYLDRDMNEIVGGVLREIRTDNGWSLTDVMERSGGTIDTSALGMYERGERTVSAARLIDVCAVLQVNVRDVVSIIEQRKAAA